MPIIAGVDWRDPAIVPMPLGDPKAIDLKNLRVAFHTDNGIVSPTPETVVVVRNAARALSNAGLAVEEERPTGIEQAYEIFFGLFAADGGSAIQLLLRMAGTTEARSLIHGVHHFTHPCTTGGVHIGRVSHPERDNDVN